MSTDVLLVVDVQVDVMGECVRAEEVVGRVKGLVERARERGVPVVWVRHSADDELVRGSDGWQIVPELAPAEGEAIVDKRYGDAFADTDLEARLRERGAERVVLCGAQTDFCIRSTMFGGLYRGWPMVLVTDAHTTGDYRDWAGYGPDEVVAVVNQMARGTSLPGIASAATTAAEAFAG